MKSESDSEREAATEKFIRGQVEAFREEILQSIISGEIVFECDLSAIAKVFARVCLNQEVNAASRGERPIYTDVVKRRAISAMDHFEQNLTNTFLLAMNKLMVEASLIGNTEAVKMSRPALLPSQQLSHTLLQNLALMFDASYRNTLNVELRGKGRKPKTPEKIEADRKEAAAKIPQLKRELRQAGGSATPEYWKLVKALDRAKNKAGVTKNKRKLDK